MATFPSSNPMIKILPLKGAIFLPRTQGAQASRSGSPEIDPETRLRD
jgi:hypothetical protein